MNSIEKDFRSEMDQIETERLDSELPVILAGKVERFIQWKDKTYINQWENNDGTISYPLHGTLYTLYDLYNYFINNVDNK